MLLLTTRTSSYEYNKQILLPLQDVPFPMNPGLQKQSKLPNVSKHVALRSQSLSPSSHSLIPISLGN